MELTFDFKIINKLIGSQNESKLNFEEKFGQKVLGEIWWNLNCTW